LLERVGREAPETAPYWGAKGYVSMRQGDLEGAEAAFNRAIALEPSDAATLRNRGILRHRTGRRALAYDDLRASLRYDSNDLNALSELAQIYERTGHRMHARPILERVVGLYPNHTEAWLDLSLAQADPDEAIASVDRALQLAPQLPRAHQRRCALLARSRRNEAISACTRALQAMPGDPWILMHRGLAHYHLDHTADALTDMDAAIEARPEDPVMRTNRYLVRQHAGRVEDARADLRIACELGHQVACNTLH
jgi:tetratricopeptide (TPR) repeat protein